MRLTNNAVSYCPQKVINISPSFRRRPESSHQKTLRSRQKNGVVPLAWKIANHLDTGLRRYDGLVANELSGFKPDNYN
jgi:hypothetical protein